MLKVKLHYTEEVDIPNFNKSSTEVKIVMEDKEHIKVFEVAEAMVDFLRKIGFSEQIIKDSFEDILDFNILD